MILPIEPLPIDLLNPALPATAARLRSGTAARLAGVPVATLRVWERRYGVVAAPKTPTGQRLYSSHDVQRLRLLKQLSDRGHAIGTIAGLELETLRDLASASPATAMPLRHWVVVGQRAAQKMSALAGCEVLAVHESLDALDGAAAGSSPAMAEPVDVLLVQLPSLQATAAAQVLKLGAALRAARTVVLYDFGTEAVAESMRAAGIAVRREPVSALEIARLAEAEPPAAAPPAALRVEPRRFDDTALAALAVLPSPVACECPRHMAELVTQLAGFERYSADCSAISPADAALHRHLTQLAGAARTLFEQALEQVVLQEAIVVPGWPGPKATV